MSATTEKAKTVKTPQDHQKEEAAGVKDVTVEWHGHEYLITGEAIDDAEVLEFLTDNNMIGALRQLLGPKVWAEYKERERNGRGRVTASGATEFTTHIFETVKRGNS